MPYTAIHTDAVYAESNFGCVGDGVLTKSSVASPSGYTYWDVTSGTDNTQAIISALSYCISNGTRLVFGPGIFRVTSAITLAFGVYGPYIEGAGMGRTIFAVDHFDDFMYFTGDAAQLGAAVFAGFSFFRKDPRNAPTSMRGKKGLYTKYSNDPRIEDIESVGALGYGIQFELCDGIVGRNPFPHDHLEGVNGTDGMHLYMCTNANVTGGRAHHIADDAFSAGSYSNDHPSAYNEFTNIAIQDCGGAVKFYGRVIGGKIESVTAWRCAAGAAQYRSDPNNGAMDATGFRFVDIALYDQPVSGTGLAAAACVLAPGETGSGVGTTCVIDNFVIDRVFASNASRAVTVSPEGGAVGKRIMEDFTISNVCGRNIGSNGVLVGGWGSAGFTISGDIDFSECGYEGVLTNNFQGMDDTVVNLKGNWRISGASKLSPGTYRSVWLRDGNSLIDLRLKASLDVTDQYFSGATRQRGLLIGAGCKRKSFVNAAGFSFDDTCTGVASPNLYRSNFYSAEQAPTSGTWKAGDVVHNSLTWSEAWTFSQAGTYGTLTDITGSAIAESNLVEVSSLIDANGQDIQAGDVLTVSGAGPSGADLIAVVIETRSASTDVTAAIFLNQNCATTSGPMAAPIQRRAPTYYTAS